MGVCTESTVDEHAWELVSVLAASMCVFLLPDHMETRRVQPWLMLI